MKYFCEVESEKLCLIMIFEEASGILKCIKQYKFIVDKNCNAFDTIYKGYPDLYVSTIDAFRYQIIVGTAKLVTNSTESICIDKVLNILEQKKLGNLIDSIKKIRKEKEQYSQLIEELCKIRDKVYAHIDYKYTKSKDSNLIFDLVDSKIYTDVEEILLWLLEKCVEISKKYDGDKMLFNLKLLGLRERLK